MRAGAGCALLALLCAAGAGCAGPDGPAGGLPADELRRKMLRYQEVQLPHRQFFVGVATAGDLDSATAAAYAALSRELTALPAGSRELLRARYRVDRTGTDGDGQVHVLAVLEREDASTHLRGLRDTRREALRFALPGCAGKLKTGDVAGARACMGDLQRLVAEARDLHVASRAVVGDESRQAELPEEADVLKLEEQLRASERLGSSVLVGVLRLDDGEVTGDLNSTVSALLSRNGFKLVSGKLARGAIAEALGGATRACADQARLAGAGYVVLGELRAAAAGEELGMHFALADARLKVVETVSGRTVAELGREKVKGGHVTARQARDKAVENALSALAAELTQKLPR